jgi:hypothetical protein
LTCSQHRPAAASYRRLQQPHFDLQPTSADSSLILAFSGLILTCTVNLGLVSMNYIFRERNLIYLHWEDKVRKCNCSSENSHKSFQCEL